MPTFARGETPDAISSLLSDALKNCRILVVTDRVDLEKQLSKTFLTGGAFGTDMAAKKSGAPWPKLAPASS